MSGLTAVVTEAPVCGMTWGWTGVRGTWATPRAAESMRRMTETGVNWTAITYAAVQATAQSTQIPFDAAPTVTDAEIVWAIREAKSLGLQVVLKPVVNVADGTWRAYIGFFDWDVPGEPTWTEWFASYTAFIVHAATIAEAEGADLFCIGCEMVRADGQEAHWRALIARVRQVYTGPITYNCDKYQEDRVTWWDAVDVISSSGYYPLGTFPEHLDRIAGVLERFDKPFLFMEAGCPSRTGSAARPNDWSLPGSPSGEEQERYYRDMLDAIASQPWVRGYLLWDWPAELYPASQAAEDDGYCVYGKPAAAVLAAFNASFLARGRTMGHAPDVLCHLTERLLRCAHAGEAKPVVDALVARLAELTGVELHPDGFRDEHATVTARGKAVSLTTAAQCGEDVERTRVFLQGVHAGLVHTLARVAEHAPVHVLYAGTGPFGLLLLPLLPLLPPADLARLRVTLLDIHAESLAALKVVVEHLGVQESIEAFVQADACEWQPPQRFDVILSETMHAGLEREPQVSVFAHLSGFLAEGGVLIPEAVVVNLWLSRGRGAPRAPGDGSREHLGELFRLDRRTAEQLGAGDRSGLQGHLSVPAHPAQLEHLEVSTVVHVFGEHGLSEGQSILTLPVYTKHARVQPETVLRFRYVLDARPRWEFEHERRPSLLDTPMPNREAASPLGLLHLPRLWHRTQLQKQGSRTQEERDRVRAQLSSVPADEWDLDAELFRALGVEPAPAMERLFRAETLEHVEAWLLAQRADVPRDELIALVNRALVERLDRADP